ncbi:MAG: hypothetical protein EZS28_024336, partial [Streblomastix strix]
KLKFQLTKCEESEKIITEANIEDENYQLFIDNQSALVYADKQYISDGQANNFALKINTDDKLVAKDLQELARQTHFRGYYQLNNDIINLASSAVGDFAFSAESGTVWMYESSWYDSGQLVPDQVTPASDELPIVDGAASARISTSYSRGDHKYPQKLTYDGNVTATKFIKTGGTNNYILLANGDTKKVVLATSNYDDGLRISRAVESTGGSAILLGCSRTSNTGVIAGQWQIFTSPNNYDNNPLGFVKSLSSDSGYTTRGLCISSDVNTLIFNRQIIAGTDSAVGSVNYSQGNPILWGANSTGTEGGFYSNGNSVFWRDHAIQFDPYYQEQ